MTHLIRKRNEGSVVTEEVGTSYGLHRCWSVGPTASRLVTVEAREGRGEVLAFPFASVPGMLWKLPPFVSETEGKAKT